MQNNFSENLKKLRIQQNLLQKDLAEKMGTTQRRVSYLESGKIEPDVKTLLVVSNIFEVSIDDLIKDKI